jgi:hypothetical protein
MGQSLRAFKKSTLLSEIVQELFDSPPLAVDFKFKPSRYADIESNEFRDEKGNRVEIFFTEVGDSLYEIEFSVEGNSFQAHNNEYTIKDYSKLLATIAQGVSKFIEQYQPQGILVKGTDIFNKVLKNPNMVGQKDRLYSYFIAQIEDTGEYMIDRSRPPYIALMKK